MLRKMLAATTTIAVTLFAADMRAQEYPAHPVRIVVPFGPGTGIDGVGRVLAAKLAAEFGQSVFVDNRAGASGMIGGEVVAKSPPDGYTLLLASVSVFGVNPATFAKLPYDSATSFTPISMVYTQPLAVAVSLKLPAATLPELVRVATAKPGSISAGTLGSFQTLALQQFSSATSTRILNVPYKTSAMTALLSGEIDMTLDVISLVLPQSRAGKIKALAVTTAQRSPLAPDLPTVAEFGYPGFDMTAWTALVGPANMPRPIVDRLNKAVAKVVAAKDVVDQFASQGVTMVSSTPEQLGAYIPAEVARWKKVASDAGIKPQ